MVTWRPLIGCRALSAHQFSTRHNFFDTTPNQVSQMAKLIYSTSSTNFMRTQNQIPAKTRRKTPNKFRTTISDLQKWITPSILSQIKWFKCLNSSTRRELQFNCWSQSQIPIESGWKMASEVTQLAPELPGPVKLDTCQLPIDLGRYTICNRNIPL